jgi:AraC-like DNA-binding protein
MRLLVVPIRYVSCLAAVVERAGGDATELLGSAKVDEASLEMPDAFISPRQLDALLLNARSQTGRSDIGLELGLRIPLTAHDMLGLAAITAATVDMSLRVVAHYYTMITGMYQMRYTRGADGGLVSFSEKWPISSKTRQMHIDILVGSFHAQLMRRLRTRKAGLHVLVGASAPTHYRKIANLYPGSVHFDPDLADLVHINLPSDELDRPLKMSNAQTFRRARKACDERLARFQAESGWRGWASDVIRSIDNEWPTLGKVAMACNSSARTLDRRLRREETTFRELCTTVRYEQAKEMLEQQDLQISEIAYRLGYGEPANFSRAFARMAGVSPVSFRRMGKGH